MLPIFADPDEQKIGVAVDPISGKTAVVGDACSNRTHFGGSISHRGNPWDRIGLSAISIVSQFSNVGNIPAGSATTLVAVDDA
jgi:hypothetical protein